MTDNIVPVILSGGSGSRLWPLSRESSPKQFLPLVEDRTMLQATWHRAAPIAGSGPIVVANVDHRFTVAEQLREAGAAPRAIVLEPTGRNTAPAIAVAALEAISQGDDPLLLVMPSDHVISDEPAFRKAVETAIGSARQGKLVTFGIVPHRAETGYGYVRAPGSGSDARPVARFVEKPDLATAEGYVAQGDYFWNSGMFLFRASRYLSEMQALQPGMLSCCRRAHETARRDEDFVRLDEAVFADCPSDSIDYAIFEKTADAVLVPLDAGWNDIGSWGSLWEVTDRDSDGNAHRGEVVAIDCSNTFCYSDRLVAMVGLDDIVVVDTPDALLVGRRDQMQAVKEIVDRLRRQGHASVSTHRKVYRPWGCYDSIDTGERFQVKRITVKPGAALSLQMHHHRAEHWVVVSGTARVTRGEDTLLLGENQSIYIPLGTKHRLENPGRLPLELIEVQSGSYLGEDDIVRFEDVYGRTQ